MGGGEGKYWWDCICQILKKIYGKIINTYEISCPWDFKKQGVISIYLRWGLKWMTSQGPF